VAISKRRTGDRRRFVPWFLLAVLSVLTLGGLVLALETNGTRITVDQLKVQLLDVHDLGPRWKQSGIVSSKVTADDWNDARCPTGSQTFGGPTVTVTYVNPNLKETFTESLEGPSVDPGKVIHAFLVCPIAPAHTAAHVTISRTTLFEGIGSASVGYIDTFRVDGHKEVIGGDLFEEGEELVGVGYVGSGHLPLLRTLATRVIAKVDAG